MRIKLAIAACCIAGHAFAQGANNPPVNVGAFTATTLTSLANTYVQGVFIVDPPGINTNAGAYLIKGGTSGNVAYLQGQMNTTARWQLDLGDQATESGSDTGSNLNIWAYHDNGTLITPAYLTISRATGLAQFAGSIVHEPGTAFTSGVVPGIFQIYSPTGNLGAAASGTINAFSMTTDNAAINDPGTIFLFTVQDASFGGAAAKGGRIMGYFGFTQTAASESSHTFRSYIGAQTAINTTSGDGGGAGTEKGDYYGLWDTNILGASATHVKSMTGVEIDMDAVTGSSVLYKSAIFLGGGNLAGTDSVQGTTVDAGLWMSQATGSIGFKNGIYFGRTDGVGGLGVSTTGTLIATANEVATVGNGIDLTGGGNTTITTAAFKSPGFSVDGGGNIVGNTANIVNTGSYSWGASLASITASTDLFFDNASGAYKFRASGTEKIRLTRAGHIASLGAAPALTSCGTGSPSITASSSDFAGTVTEGTTATGCTLTFATAYTNAPDCVVSWISQYPAAFTYTTATGTLIVTNTSTSGLKFSYHCQQI